jgi:ribonuclease HI
MDIYTDGSSIQNEKAGIGILFCHPNYERISLDVSHEGKTSSFAELKAIQIALQTIDNFNGIVRINTDSQ